MVLVPTRNDLTSAQAILGGPLDQLTEERAEEAKRSIQSAIDRLNGVTGKLLGAVPVLGANLDAVEAVAEAILPTIDAGLELKTRAEELEDTGLFKDGRVRLDAFATLEEPLAEQVETLTGLEEEIKEQRSGSLWPSLWEAFSDLNYDVRTIRDSADSLRSIVDVIDPMLGGEEKRTYLILLLNNAELRGAGGILTGVGTLTAEDGELKLGEFSSVHALRTEKQKTVQVPEDYERYNVYQANDTSTWLNASYSPDVVDSAIVAARLYEKVTGTATDGAIAVDPRGIAALMPGDAEIEVPFLGEKVATDDLADFVYSDAYEKFEDQQERRAAILEVGARAFEHILDADLDDQEDIERVADAFSAGHIRFVSFEPDELKALNEANATGAVPDLKSDGLLVAAQNRGGAVDIGSKMDYWAERSVSHTCSLASSKKMKCLTQVSLTNDAPRGLPAYVTGLIEPYGLMRSIVEVYVPKAGEVTSVTRDGEPIERITGSEGGFSSSGIYVEIPLGKTSEVAVAYDLPLEGDYSLEALPQPLARDADLQIALDVPRDWTIRGPGRWEDDIYRYRGTFDATLTIKAFPTEREGISSFGDWLEDFWNEPLF